MARLFYTLNHGKTVAIMLVALAMLTLSGVSFSPEAATHQEHFGGFTLMNTSSSLHAR